MEKLSGHVFVETSYNWANVGAVLTHDGLVLIDCPVRPSDSRKWQEQLRSLTPQGPRFLIGTDFHGDHTTGAAFVPDVTFIAPQLVCDAISDTSNEFSKKIFVDALRDQGLVAEAVEIEQAAIPVPHICFDDKLTLNLDPLTLEVYRKGGHSPACSVVYIPQEKVLFASDVVLNTPSQGLRDADINQWIDALAWVEALPVDIIVPGHGDVCDQAVVRRLKSRLEELKHTMQTYIQSGYSKTEAIRESAFDKYFFADTSKGELWLRQRRETFRNGLARVYDQLKSN